MTYLMEDEINSQGKIIENLINNYIVNYCVLIDIPLNIKRIELIASGSSYNAALFGKYFFQNIAKIDAKVEFASEIANSPFDNFDSETLYIFISQSGNSTDTVLAMEKVKKTSAETLVITNNVQSKMYELADYKFDIHAGCELAVAATKTFSASVIMLWLIALRIAQNKHIDIGDETKNVYRILSNIENTLKDCDNIDLAAKFVSGQRGLSICGFNYYYAMAREAALKIKETSYINTSSYPLGEFIHGHFALLNKSNAFLVYLTSDCSAFELKMLEKILSTYKTKSIVISDVYEDYNCDILIKFPKSNSKIASIISMIIVTQLLALKIAIKLKRNVDKPKGLNKVIKG